MQLIPRPNFEFDRRAAAWGAVAYVAAAGAFLAAGGDWVTFLLAGAVAGLVVALRSGFYAQTANTGLVAGIVGFVCFTPLLFAQQFVVFQIGGMETGDSALFAAVFLSGQILSLAPASGLFGYVVAALSDMILRRVGVVSPSSESNSRR